MQCRCSCSCQYYWSIHDYVVPIAHGCVYTCTVHTDCYCRVVSLTDQSIASIQGTPHTYHTHIKHTDKAQCWAWAPQLKTVYKVMFGRLSFAVTKTLKIIWLTKCILVLCCFSDYCPLGTNILTKFRKRAGTELSQDQCKSWSLRWVDCADKRNEELNKLLD